MTEMYTFEVIVLTKYQMMTCWIGQWSRESEGISEK